MTTVHDEDFVLVTGSGRFLHKDNKSSTDALKNARTYKTWQGANCRAKNTNYKYIRVDELGDPVAKAPKHKTGSNFSYIRRKAKNSAYPYSALSDTLDKKSGFDSIVREREFTPFVECLILASEGDDLSALLKSRALEEIDKGLILSLCQENAKNADKIISDALASEAMKKWLVRRKARNIQRRLLRAILYHECGMSLQATKGARYNMLLNLARNKNLI